MLEQNNETLVDPARLAAVKEAVRLLPGTALSLDGLARLAAHLLEAPMAVISAVDDVREQWIVFDE